MRNDMYQTTRHGMTAAQRKGGCAGESLSMLRGAGAEIYCAASRAQAQQARGARELYCERFRGIAPASRPNDAMPIISSLSPPARGAWPVEEQEKSLPVQATYACGKGKTSISSLFLRSGRLGLGAGVFIGRGPPLRPAARKYESWRAPFGETWGQPLIINIGCRTC